VVVGEEVTMPLNFKALGGTLLTIAAVVMAAPLLAQQNPPAAGPDAPPDTGTPPPSGLGAPPPAVPPQQAAPPQAAPAGPAKVALATANVNLRSGPGTDSEVITTIPGGSTVRLSSCDGEWCAVTWNGHSGYAIARNLDTGASRQARPYRPQPGYAGGYEPRPPVVYGAPGYYPPPAVVYGPGYYGYGAGYYGYGPGYYYGWRRRW
jgi:hypothetical protein